MGQVLGCEQGAQGCAEVVGAELAQVVIEIRERQRQHDGVDTGFAGCGIFWEG